MLEFADARIATGWGRAKVSSAEFCLYSGLNRDHFSAVNMVVCATEQTTI